MGALKTSIPFSLEKLSVTSRNEAMAAARLKQLAAKAKLQAFGSLGMGPVVSLAGKWIANIQQQ